MSEPTKEEISAAMSHLSKLAWKKIRATMTETEITEMMTERGLKGGRPRKKLDKNAA